MSYRNIKIYTEKRVILIYSLGRKALIQYRELNEKLLRNQCTVRRNKILCWVINSIRRKKLSVCLLIKLQFKVYC